MSNFDRFLELITAIQIWDIARLIVVFVLFLYTLFALIVLKQVNLMSKTLIVPIDSAIKIIVRFHLYLAALIFLLALIIL